MNTHGIPFALKNGMIVSISEVERGLKCECQCPQCFSLLIARKGKINTHHFAHASGADCKGAFETAIHLAAKDILIHSSSIIVNTMYGARHELFYDAVSLEKKIGKYIPDVVVNVKFRQTLNEDNENIGDLKIENQKLWIEVKVTHGIEEEKREYIVNNKINCIEIDLAYCQRDISKDKLIDIVLFNPKNKKVFYYWINEEIKEIEREEKARLANKELIEVMLKRKNEATKRRKRIEKKTKHGIAINGKKFFDSYEKMGEGRIEKLKAMIRICERAATRLKGRAKAEEIQRVEKLKTELKNLETA